MILLRGAGEFAGDVAVCVIYCLLGGCRVWFVFTELTFFFNVIFISALFESFILERPP